VSKPLLLIDVDGPLNAFGGPFAGLPAPDGYAIDTVAEWSAGQAENCILDP